MDKVIEKEPDSELSDKAREFKKAIRDEEAEKLFEKEVERNFEMKKLVEVGKVIEKADRMAIRKIEFNKFGDEAPKKKVHDYIDREFVVEELLSPVDRKKFEWYPCWRYFWQAQKEAEGMRRAYEGTDEQWAKHIRFNRLGLMTPGLKLYNDCFRFTSDAINDEFIMQRRRRDLLLDKVAERLSVNK